MATSSIRLHILSDLHLSQGGLAVPETPADVVVLAGDIARPRQAMEWAARFAQPVVYIAGNHEYYGDSLRATTARLRELAQGTRIHILERDEVIIRGARFLGTTLWTGFNLHTDETLRRQAVDQAVELIRDFSRIESDEHPGKPFTPREAAALHARNCAWLAGKLAQPFSGPTIVVTHHAPSAGSIHPRFAGSPLNDCFVSNSDHLLGLPRTPLWIHGHTHDSFDYTVDGTRIVCNPRGYAKNGVNENALFNPGLVVDVAL